MSNNNNLREQFPGIAKTDNALNIVWNIMEKAAWLYLMIWTLSGWHVFVNTILNRRTDKYSGLLWGLRVLVLYVLWIIAALIIHGTVLKDKKYAFYLLHLPTGGIIGAMTIGAVLGVIATIIQSVVPSRSTTKPKAPKYKYSNAPKGGKIDIEL